MVPVFVENETVSPAIIEVTFPQQRKETNIKRYKV